MLAAAAAAALLGSARILAVALVAVLAVQALLLLELRGIRRDGLSAKATGDIRQRLNELERLQHLTAVSLYDPARTRVEAGRNGRPRDLVRPAARALLERGDVLDAYSLLASSGNLHLFGLTPLRKLRNELRRRGYLAHALAAAEPCAKSGDDEDRRLHALLKGELAVLSGAFVPTVPAHPAIEPRVPGRILHLVGKSLPDSQAGYTLRTHYIATAQRDAGLDPHIVTQMGFGRTAGAPVEFEVDGVPHYRIPGPARGSVPMDEWLQGHVQAVAALVARLRPAVLHAASDYLNALTANAVGTAYDIPVVYESRGFWEETWLSRQARTYSWDLARLEQLHGLPDAYTLRRDIEDKCRREADQVVTLAEVMADRIEAGGVSRSRITVVPNAVDVPAFPILRRNQELAERLGITSESTVIGYISSIVEYEGIDTLIDAYALVKGAADTPVKLLIVGDGPDRPELERQAARLHLDVIFTGQVAHEEVLDYYGVIDIFVVPRRPVEVCHLVTPLKPFEAFSTGRTVVLSNVRALARIAEESRAAELFDAGDEFSLAAVLLRLLKDPDRRRELAEVGSRWVRAERTWAANARTYARLYAGILGAGSTAVQGPAGVEVDDLRRAISARGPIPFERLSSDDYRGGADEIMAKGWVVPNHPAVNLDPPLDWLSLCRSNRSWNFRLHSWDFMGPVLAAARHTGDSRYLHWCVDRAVSWARAFNDGDARGTMAWYDMALGLRGHRLAYLVEQAVLADVEADKVAVLLQCVARHQREFFADRAFNPRNNHGVYVALGQMAFARRFRMLPGMPALETQGRRRLRHMIDVQFAADGGHREHSPEYHRMLVFSFSGALAAGLLDDDEVRARIEAAEEAVGWFIQPNGELVQIGDSFARQMRSQNARTSSPTTEFMVSGGSRGRPNRETLKVLPDAGYAIVRSPQPQGRDDHDTAGYLTLAAGFHSRVHKHADDLSITWFDRGREILIDAGRYGYVDLLPKDSPQRLQGYYYSAPERQYVESTRAHNTVEADGADHLRRNRKPYGSAIRTAEERDGCYRMLAAVDHGSWRHRREIIYRPGCWLMLNDRVVAQDDRDHEFRVWFNFPAELSPRVAGHGAFVIDLPAAAEQLWVVELGSANPIEPISGQRSPMRGWRSKADLVLTPAWSAGFEAAGVRMRDFTTVFAFGERPTGPFDHPFS